jgi:hypothetical protein
MDHRMYAEKSLEMARDYPVAFGAWLILEAVQNRLHELQGKIETWLENADRKALSHG